MKILMKPNPKCFYTGHGLFIMVHNYPNLNEVGHYFYNEKKYTDKDYFDETSNLHAIGRWIPKTKTN